MLQVTLNFGIAFAEREKERERGERERERGERERERERERESSTVDKFYYSINKYVYMERAAFVISV